MYYFQMNFSYIAPVSNENIWLPEATRREIELLKIMYLRVNGDRNI